MIWVVNVATEGIRRPMISVISLKLKLLVSIPHRSEVEIFRSVSGITIPWWLDKGFSFCHLMDSTQSYLGIWWLIFRHFHFWWQMLSLLWSSNPWLLSHWGFLEQVVKNNFFGPGTKTSSISAEIPHQVFQCLLVSATEFWKVLIL